MRSKYMIDRLVDCRALWPMEKNVENRENDRQSKHCTMSAWRLLRVPGGDDLDEDSFRKESDRSGWTTGINECGEFQGYTTTACLESGEDSG